jgi:dolichyl-phosphate-mannose--protein O-mannosyl transferase
MASIVIALISFGMSMWKLGRPKSLVFDEVYYVDGARDLLKYGVEVTGKAPEFIVHPPVGKWFIGLGIKIFGDNSFGWRFAVALVGALTIILVARIALYLFESQFISAFAAGLMAMDGLHLVHSRTALLDLFLTFFVLCGALSWLKRNYWLTGISFGLAIGTKWSGVYFLAIFAIITIYRDLAGTELKELRNRMKFSLKGVAQRFAQFIFIPLAVYIASWAGWFISSRGWDRHWAEKHPTSFSFIPDSIRSFWHYHAEILHFHTTLTEHHSYQANPWSWLVMGRPTSFFYETPKSCGASSCSQEVLALGTPLLWWACTIALAILIGYWIANASHGRKDKRISFILSGVIAGYLPWFFFQKRTVFSFYAIVFEPFLILSLTYCVHKYLGIAPWKRKRVILVIALVAAIALNFIYFMPIFNGSVISYDQWHQRMWWPSWI